MKMKASFWSEKREQIKNNIENKVMCSISGVYQAIWEPKGENSQNYYKKSVK